MLRGVLLILGIAGSFGFAPHPKSETVITDLGCIDRLSDGMRIYRIVIDEGDGSPLAYLEEIPCDSGNWYYRTTAGSVRPHTGTPATFDDKGNIVVSSSFHRGGTLVRSAAPGRADFTAPTDDHRVIITAGLLDAIRGSLQ